MKVTLTKATRVNALAGVVEVDEVEANRLFLLDVAEPEPAEEPAPDEKPAPKKAPAKKSK